MKNSKDEIIKRISNNLRFVITISIFFLNIFPGLQSKAGAAAFTIGYIVCYLVFEIVQNNISAKHLSWIQLTLLVGIGSYIVPLSLYAISGNSEIIPIWQGYAWLGSSLISVFLMAFIPIITLVMIGAFGNTDKE